MKSLGTLTACVMLMASLHLHAQQIYQAEYFFDTDPGVGNGTAIAIAAGDPVTFTANISTTGLGAGPHYLFVRTRTNDYKWSLSEPRLINVASIVKAEYFVDTDPGTGNGTAMSVAAGSLSFTANLDISSLMDGPHYLYVRTRQETGRWSIPEPRYFYILTRIMAAEYFIDSSPGNSDPGVGNGTPLVIAAPASVVNFTPTLNIGALADGTHQLIVRTKDALGIWSLFEALPFTVDSALPIELTAFNATALETGHVRLNWQTETELNNDYFTAQHSIDGMEFTAISKVPGAGTSTSPRHYETIHTNPPSGRNFYRLKQTDFDGTVTFSRIVPVDVTGPPTTVIYPNPASDEWFVSFSDGGVHKVEVVDLLGRKCFEVLSDGGALTKFTRHGLADGTYLVKVTSEDGSVAIKKLVLKQ